MDAAAASSPRAGKKQKAPSDAASPAVGGSKPKRLKTAQAGIVTKNTELSMLELASLMDAYAGGAKDKYQARPQFLNPQHVQHVFVEDSGFSRRRAFRKIAMASCDNWKPSGGKIGSTIMADRDGTGSPAGRRMFIRKYGKIQHAVECSVQLRYQKYVELEPTTQQELPTRPVKPFSVARSSQFSVTCWSAH